MSEMQGRTGAERYLAERLEDPEYRAAFDAAREESSMRRLQRQCLTDSRHWFPLWNHGSLDERVHQALGIAGEAGEVVEHLKKEHRGDQLDILELGRELADVPIYVMNLAESVGIDLEAAIDAKRQLNIARWGEPPELT